LLSLTGLTTGGVTAALDRLEKAGYIRRQPNPGDRRSVLVRAIPRRVRRVKANYRTNERRWNALLDGFTEAELSRRAEVLHQHQRRAAGRVSEINPDPALYSLIRSADKKSRCQRPLRQVAKR
jgi:DNA-binding MarR family transcriptional regulator